MKREDLDFKKQCRQYINSIRFLLKKGQIKESDEIINKISNSLKQWEEYQKSVNLKVRALKELQQIVVFEKRKLGKSIIKKSTTGGN